MNATHIASLFLFAVLIMSAAVLALPSHANAAISKLGTDVTDTEADFSVDLTHTLVAGSNRAVVCTVAIENDSDPGSVSGTYGGNAMTQAVFNSQASFGFVSILYILEANLPANGAQTVIITPGGSASGATVQVTCSEYGGVKQQAPEYTDSLGEASPGDATIETTVVPTGGAWVISVALVGNAGATWTHGQSQVEISELNTGGSSSATAELRDATAGSIQLDSTESGVAFNRLARASASFASAISTIIVKPPNNLGLVGYWPFNEATSTIAGDFSGQGNHATTTLFASPPTATSGWGAGKSGKALNFDGTNDYVGGVGDPASGVLDFGANQAFTLSVWIKGTVVGGFIITKRGSAGYQLNSVAASGLIQLRIDEGAANVDLEIPNSDTTVMDGRWHHIVAGRSSAGNFIYLDGVSANSNSDTTLADLSDTRYFSIGGGPANGGSYWGGSIDEVRVYNRALSGLEIAALYGQGAIRVNASSKTLTQGSTLGASGGLVGHWTFDGGDLNWTSNTAGVAYDGSGRNNIGTLTTMSRSSAPVIGKLGQALNFDGSDDYISIPNASSIDISGSAITLAAWVYSDGTGDSEQTIIGKVAADGTHNDPFFAYQLSLETVTGDTYKLRFGLTLGGVYRALAPATTLSTGTWRHVVGVYDGTTMALYTDGTLFGSTAETGNINSYNATLRLGQNGAGTERLKARADDIRIYNRALSATEVLQLYRLGQASIRP